MEKKRDCRQTMNENIIHKKAAKMRGMTDLQLVLYVNDRVEKARSEGSNKGKAQVSLSQYKSVSIEGIVNEIGNVLGIGAAQLAGIQAVLEKRLEVRANV